MPINNFEQVLFKDLIQIISFNLYYNFLIFSSLYRYENIKIKLSSVSNLLKFKLLLSGKGWVKTQEF